MSKIIDIQLPVTRAQLATLAVGDEVRLFGTIYTMRDAGHARALAHLSSKGELPFELAGHALFYAGPTAPVGERPFGAIGPTTASRMDFAAPQLYEAGITVTLGKGARSAAVAAACAATGSVYLIAVGGAAALLASYVRSSELVAWEDLGPEALRRLTLDGLPAFVGIDAMGNTFDAMNPSKITGLTTTCHQNETMSEIRDETTETFPPSCLVDRAPFITFEGGDGVGKSTQIRLLQARLEAAGYEVLCLREPGGTGVGEQIRAILLDPANDALQPLSELLLYEAARAQLVQEVIVPALAAGTVVLCDRYYDSTFAYQVSARGLDVSLVEAANQIGSDGLTPTRTILLEQDVSKGLEKAAEKGADRLEAEGLAFHQKVHDGFAQLARAYPKRIRCVPCCEEKSGTAAAVFEQVKDLFPWAATEEALAGFQITDELLQTIKDSK
jgi:dTMP kinase